MQKNSVNEFWKRKIVEDFGNNSKFDENYSDIVYYKEYLKLLKVQDETVKEFSEMYIETCKMVFEDQSTTLTDLILSKDIGSIKYQLSSEIRRNSDFFKDLLKAPAKNTIPALDRMLLFLSIGTNDVNIVKYILENGGNQLLQFADPVNGVTVFHLSMLLGNIEILEVIIESLINNNIHDTIVTKVDSFRATAFDYARLKRSIPNPQPPLPKSIKVYNYNQNNNFEDWSIEQLEKALSIHYCPNVIATNDYLIDLIFSSMDISPNLKFRNKYLKLINSSGGEDNVILGYVSDQVGYGLFAGKDFEKGDYIVRYGGMVTMNEKMQSTDYNMMISNEDFGLNGQQYRSLGGMINHSQKFKNAQSECIFEGGCDQALITATKYIPKGTQIFIDYSQSYWNDSNSSNSTNQKSTSEIKASLKEMGGTKEYPSIIPSIFNFNK
ncbi:hypothetical protein DLAC_08005 [Tieghemostelium lacteum]|uniref:SET domain-containing protein n=1 Tax=Tieghemostelium lacteum TaxID=361077 RepID=A0A151ZAX8_TIELA|nr:hypothetical protein DLAC_08005 [Tieghemostelium lacteum]|eukprot:KYQ91099.1 hypothetical protein DLAC_08005 [Tieghemostelium lacteum]